MTDPRASALAKPRSSARREYTWLLLTAIAGAGLVLIGTRQTVARVVVLAPRPLPDAVVALRLADLRPAVAALALAALASLAAVLATRRLLRRIVALVTAAITVVIALLTIAAISPADVRAAAMRATASSASGAGAGSATAGTTAGSAAEPMTGLPAHALSQGSGWRALIVVGAAALLVAAITIAIRAYRLPVMSSRYGTATARPGPASPGPARPGPAAPAPASMASPAPAMWEALSAGTDPTAWPGEDDTRSPLPLSHPAPRYPCSRATLRSHLVSFSDADAGVTPKDETFLGTIGTPGNPPRGGSRIA